MEEYGPTTFYTGLFSVCFRYVATAWSGGDLFAIDTSTVDHGYSVDRAYLL
jgi:hypothetical protein